MPARRSEPFIPPAHRAAIRPDATLKSDRPSDQHSDPLETADLLEEPTADLVDAATPATLGPSLNRANSSHETAPATAATGTPAGAKQPQSKARRENARAAITEPAAGSILCDRYLLERIIGTGGICVVWRARDLQWQGSAAGSATVALKMLHPKAARAAQLAAQSAARPALQSAAQTIARLQHEFECAKKLSHPNVLRVIDLHSANGSCFMTMELAEGQLLSTLLPDRANLRESTVRRILQGCADALAHAHSRGVVHGDFKPGNVLVTADGNVKVLNFGAAATSAGTAPSDSSTGDPARIAAAIAAYASPEVLEGQLPERSDDVFSFACVAYELLALQHPFEHGRATQARDVGWIPLRAWSLSAPQWLALLAALAWQREQRTAEVGTLLAALLTHPQETVDPLPLAEAGLRPAPGVRLEKKPLSDDFMRSDRGWRYFMIALVVLILILIALR